MTEKKAEKPFAVSSHDIHLDSDYIQWIHSVKERFRNTQIKTAVKINYEQLYFNWQMGRDLAVRRMEEKWGSGIVEQISLDLKNEFPEVKGFSTTNLWYMKKWYLFYSYYYGKRKTAPDWCRNRKADVCNAVQAETIRAGLEGGKTPTGYWRNKSPSASAVLLAPQFM